MVISIIRIGMTITMAIDDLIAEVVS